MVQLQLLSCGTLLYLLDHSVNNPTLVTIYLIWSSGCISDEVGWGVFTFQFVIGRSSMGAHGC